jgi:hypothetical protein
LLLLNAILVWLFDLFSLQVLSTGTLGVFCFTSVSQFFSINGPAQILFSTPASGQSLTLPSNLNVAWTFSSAGTLLSTDTVYFELQPAQPVVPFPPLLSRVTTE